MVQVLAIFCILFAPVPVKARVSLSPALYSRIAIQFTSAWDLFLHYANDSRVIRKYNLRIQVRNLQTQMAGLKIEMSIDNLRYKGKYFELEKQRNAAEAFQNPGRIAELTAELIEMRQLAFFKASRIASLYDGIFILNCEK